MHFLQRHGTGNKAIQVYAADFLISPQGLRQSFQLILLFFQLFPLHFPLFFTDDPALFLTDRRPFPADGRIFRVFSYTFLYTFLPVLRKSSKKDRSVISTMQRIMRTTTST